MWDFSWIADPSAWAGLGTLIVLEVVLGIDNLVFISILTSRIRRNSAAGLSSPVLVWRSSCAWCCFPPSPGSSV